MVDFAKALAPLLLGSLLAGFTATAQDSTLVKKKVPCDGQDSMLVKKRGPCDDLSKCFPSQILHLQTFEDNYIGYTNDSDDEPFMEFRLSAVYEFDFFDNALGAVQAFNQKHGGDKNRFRRFLTAHVIEQNLALGFGFTGRFAQYIGTRESSPVVGKRFNPFLYLEWHPKNVTVGDQCRWHEQNTLRVSYGHESNGQAIATQDIFEAFANAIVVDPGQDARRQARDYISRGWDYVGASWTASPNCGRLTYEVAFRGYLNTGLMQGPKEEYRPWESWGNTLRRRDVSGLAGALEWANPSNTGFGNPWLGIARLRLMGTTGITQAGFLQKGGVKASVGLRFLTLPLTISYADGYDGDLAQFGRRNHSWSFGFTLNNFGAPKALTGAGLN